MHSGPWRHVIAVSVMVVVLVIVLMYYITPDVPDAVFMLARHQTRQWAAAIIRRVPGAEPAGSPGPDEVRTGADPFHPYVWRNQAADGRVGGPRRHAREILGGLALVTFVTWAGRRGKRVNVANQRRMAASLARAVRQSETL